MKIRTSTVVAISALAMIATVASTAEAKLPSLHVAPAKQSVSGNSKDRRPVVAKRLAVKQKVHTKTKTIVVIRYVILPAIVASSSPSPQTSDINLSPENCAAYTGCTSEEYCLVLGVNCDLVPSPIGTKLSSLQDAGSPIRIDVLDSPVAS